MMRMLSMSAALCVLALSAGGALAQETTTPQSGTQSTQPAPPPQSQDQSTQPAQTPNAQPAPETQPAPGTPPSAVPVDPAAGSPAAGANAAAASTDVLAAIRTAGKKADAKADQKATAALDAASNDLEKNVASDGDRKIAERLAAEFGTTPDALLAEKNDLKTSWGQLVIAHSIVANGTMEVTPKQLLDLRAEGMSWGQIANGMGLRLGQVVSAAKEEVRVGKGLTKPDGKVAVVTGAGSKADAAKAEKAAMKAAAKAEQARAKAAEAEAAKAEEAKADQAKANAETPGADAAAGKPDGGKNK